MFWFGINNWNRDNAPNVCSKKKGSYKAETNVSKMMNFVQK